MWKSSYKKTREERIKILKKNNFISSDSYDYLINSKILTNEIADKLIENQISVYGIPYGISTNFLIDGKEYVIPMAVEEPSVIAASCNAAKIIKENGGFETFIDERLIIGQIAIYDYENEEEIKNFIINNKEKLLIIANNSQKYIVNLGGGAKDIKIEKKDEFLIIYLYVNCLDAMGANTVNTMLESISILIKDKLNCKILMSIISNYATSSKVIARCSLKIDKELALKIEKAIKFANSDIYRAVTNNKGITNGIDAISIATGNDWRAIEAGLHAYACKDGNYKSLTNWTFDGEKLNGIIEIPLAIASFGGSIRLNELSRISLEILGNPSAKELSRITACVGLAQNFAALRALVTEGIQKGHMKLQLKSFALYLNANDDEIKKLENIFLNNNHIDLETVRKKLESIRGGKNYE